jgi:hypothetical protein
MQTHEQMACRWHGCCAAAVSSCCRDAERLVEALQHPSQPSCARRHQLPVRRASAERLLQHREALRRARMARSARGQRLSTAPWRREQAGPTDCLRLASAVVPTLCTLTSSIWWSSPCGSGAAASTFATMLTIAEAKVCHPMGVEGGPNSAENWLSSCGGWCAPASDRAPVPREPSAVCRRRRPALPIVSGAPALDDDDDDDDAPADDRARARRSPSKACRSWRSSWTGER